VVGSCEIYVVVKRDLFFLGLKVTRGGIWEQARKLKPFLLFVSSGWGCAGALYSECWFTSPGLFFQGGRCSG
jgi:hypothetical protein